MSYLFIDRCNGFWPGRFHRSGSNERTQTSVNVNGSVTDIHTNTLRGANAYNSFSRFNVPGGTTANLYVPDSAQNLVNLVHNEKSQIDGIMNAYKNGQIGGNVWFLNPHGIAIGQSGVVNVGSLHLVTPSQQFMEDLISKGGTISDVHTQRLFEGNVPLSESGVVSVKGRVNAVDTITITADGVNVDAGASLRAGRQVQLEFGSIVKIPDDFQTGNALSISPEGKIRIVAAQDVNVSGQIAADGIQGENAGNIEIKAGNDININAGAEITARGVGANSDGGEVIIFADNNSNLHNGGLIDVSAENGKGGFLEFSAKDTVNIQGNGLRSSAGGTIL
ncbi:MAG: leukotoxin LktA family filamentous adhesin, partial [Planctomycetaceae bacterium]|nr:leukotoxin LktA family filamentous adhesin [Planctomycetaceae bacterium]